MPEWLIERGIGETRAALVEDGEIVEARIQLDGCVSAGSVIRARLISTGSIGRNAIARDDAGVEYLLPAGSDRVSEGSTIHVEVTREAIPGIEAWKRPLARLTDQGPGPAAELEGRTLPFPAPVDVLAQVGWNEIIEQAGSGVVGFGGGELRISPTPAMTLIDVDGYLAPDELVVTGASAGARAIRRLDVGGSIGIDLPTVGSKSVRQAAAAAIDALLPQPFERTAVNGFGFVQIVRPRPRASLLELAQDRAAFEARALLRRIAFEPAGGKRIVAHPAVIGALETHPEWLDTLARHVGGEISLRAEPSLTMSGGYAEPA